MKNPVIIIQARTGSTRLPDKMLMPFHSDGCILGILLNRINSARITAPENIVVATTVSPGDDRIVSLCERVGTKVFRGSEDDVLERFIEAAKSCGGEKVIRICADNVFLDMESLRLLYEKFRDADCDYCSFITSGSVPSIRTHYGFWAEAVTLDALEKAASGTSERLYHEHVTNFIYSNPGDFNCVFIPVSETVPDIESHPDLRLTVDTVDDFSVQQEIYGYLREKNREISPENIIAYLNERPDLYAVMARNIIQNSK